jgi:hypothetical protein
MAKKYVEMFHIDKLFCRAKWQLNDNVSGIKLGNSII